MTITRRLAVVTLLAASLLSTGCHGGLRNRIRSCWGGCGACAPGFEAGYAASPVGYAGPVGHAGPAAAPGCSSCYGGGDHANVPAPVVNAPGAYYPSPYATPLPVPPGPPTVFQSSEPPTKMPEKK